MTTADDFDPWSDDALPADNGLGALAVRSRAELGERGALARAHEGFAPREAQQNLAAAVADAIMRRRALLAEAGTGTGKTYAYLVPALLSGRRVIISTGTRALQDQLFHRDLPRVRQALGVGLRAALLKGRANYLCHYRLERAQGERVHDRPRQVELAALKAWSGETRSGDIGEFDGISEDSPLWPQVTSTAENCLGNECPFWRDCFVVKARQAAQAADVVVVNHHLLFADQAIRKEGFGEILPGAECFIIDEAHQLPELASQFFGATTRVVHTEPRREFGGVKLRRIDPAYVIFDEAYESALEVIHPYLESQRIYSTGRYGAWIYNAMEDSLLAGKAAIETVESLPADENAA